MSNLEIRAFDFAGDLPPVGVEEQEDALRLTGYAALYEVRTFIRTLNKAQSFYEIFEQGSFDEAIASPDNIFLLRNHDKNLTLGNQAGGSLVLGSDQRGLTFEAVLPPTTLAKDTVIDVRSGNLTGMSVGMPTESIVDNWSYSEGKSDYPVRRIAKTDLVEVSVATVPAEAGTVVAARTAESAMSARAPNLSKRREQMCYQLRFFKLKYNH